MSNERRYRILNVDDDDAGRYATSRMLMDAGFEVAEAATGVETLRLAAEQPDLVLLDVNLPDINGFEVCARLKADPATARIPVVHLSATAIDGDSRSEGLEGGADGYLTQPIGARELVATLRALLRLSDAERLRTVLEAAHEGILLQGRDGRVRAWNAAAEDVLGVAESEIVGETVLGRDWHTVHEDGTLWPPEEFPSLKTLATGEPQHDIVMGVVRDDELRWISINSEPVFSPDETGPSGAVVTFADITERKRTERLMVLPSEILGIIASTTSVHEIADGVTAALKRATGFDAVGLRLRQDDDYPFIGSLGYTDEFLAAENVLTERSPGNELCRNADGSINLECTCGLVISGAADPADPLFTPGGSAWTNDSLPFLDVPPEDDPRLHPRNRCIHVGFRSLALVPLRAGEQILGLIHLGDRRTGRLTQEWVTFLEGLGASIGVAIQSKETEQALRTSEEKYRVVADNTYDWEWWTRPDGSYVYVSPGCTRITGRAPAEFLADAGLLEAITHREDRAALREHFVQGTSDASAPHELVFRVHARSGEERVVEHLCKPVYDADGTYLGRRGSNRDITERRRAEDEIRRLNAELADRFVSRTEQMEAANRELEALAYSVAHDVRTPLRTIDGFSELLIQDESERLSPEGVDQLRRVRGAAQTLARLLDELTGLSEVSRRELVRQTVDLSGLAAEIGAELAALDPSRAVELSVAPGLTAEADPTLVRLVLLSLLDNAWKFTRRRDHAHVEVGATDADGERAFFVRDDGAGFDMRRAGHLFGVFQRLHTPEEFEGDGVGLATVQRLVRRHGGAVWAQAEVGHGATFFFTLAGGAG